MDKKQPFYPLNEEPTNKWQTQLGEKRLASKDISTGLFVRDLVMLGRQQMECLILILLQCMSQHVRGAISSIYASIFGW